LLLYGKTLRKETPYTYTRMAPISRQRALWIEAHYASYVENLNVVMEQMSKKSCQTCQERDIYNLRE